MTKKLRSLPPMSIPDAAATLLNPQRGTIHVAHQYRHPTAIIESIELVIDRLGYSRIKTEAGDLELRSECTLWLLEDVTLSHDTRDVTSAVQASGRWMQTYTGHRFYPTDPRSDDVSILDIAHSLAMQCRYNGSTVTHYSVAEHCVLMSRWVAPENALWALLHDATEAYIGDVIRPLKLDLPQFKAIEAGVERTIAEHFDLALPRPDQVEEADRRIVADERAAMLRPCAFAWEDDLTPLGIAVYGWTWQRAETEFLDRFHDLNGGL